MRPAAVVAAAAPEVPAAAPAVAAAPTVAAAPAVAAAADAAAPEVAAAARASSRTSRAAVAALAGVAALGVTALGGCLHRGLPQDARIETTRPIAPPWPRAARELRVVTFNVHGEPGDVIAAALRSDRALRDADVIVLEEVHRADRAGQWCSGACQLARELGFHAVFAPGHDNGRGSDGVAIVSRLPISSAQVIELPYFDVVFNSGRRVALAATVDLDGRPVTVYAVHLDNRLTVRQRRRQLEPVLAHAAGRDTPIIMAGDFNTSPFTWLGHVVPLPTGNQDDCLEALLRARGFATPVAGSGATSRFLGMKLDAIYTRGFTTVRFATSRARDISDHLALWALLRPAPAAPAGHAAPTTHATSATHGASTASAAEAAEATSAASATSATSATHGASTASAASAAIAER